MRLCDLVLRQCASRPATAAATLWRRGRAACAAPRDFATGGFLRRSSSSRAAAAAAAAAAGEPPGWQPAWEQRRRYSSGGGEGNGSAGSNAVLSNTTSFLRNLHNGAEIFLVGTAHVSKRSAEEVRDMIRLVKPSSVMVELCPARAAKLRAGGGSEQEFLQQMLGTFFSPGGSLSQKLVKVSLPMMYRVMKMLGMDPGGEFKVALQEADRIGARVVYGDRDVQKTLQRLSETMDLQDLMRMMSGAGLPDPPPGVMDFMMQGSGSSIESQVEGLKSRAMVREMSTYMRQVNPRLAEALIDERDQHMVESLSRLQGRVVGVVGLAHLDGIERRWEALQYSRKALAR